MSAKAEDRRAIKTGRVPASMVEKIRAAPWWPCHEGYGLTYQCCRFCRRPASQFRGLYRYAVRHYVCPPCRERFTALRHQESRDA